MISVTISFVGSNDAPEYVPQLRGISHKFVCQVWTLRLFSIPIFKWQRVRKCAIPTYD